MFFNLALKGVDSRLGVKPDSPYRVDPFCRYSGNVNVKASSKIGLSHKVEFDENEKRKDTSVMNMKWGANGANKSDHTFDRDKYLAFFTHKFYDEEGVKMTATGKMERNATKGTNMYEPGMQLEMNDLAGFRIAAQAMHSITMKGENKDQVANLQLSAFNDDLWFGFNVKRNMGAPVAFAKAGDVQKEGNQPTNTLMLLAAYYNLNKESQLFARADLANHFVSAGGTYKHADFTLSKEFYFGLKGASPTTGADMDHKGVNGGNMWMRVGVDMPISKETQVSWNCHKAEKFQSQVNFNQKVNDNVNVQF